MTFTKFAGATLALLLGVAATRPETSTPAPHDEVKLSKRVLTIDLARHAVAAATAQARRDGAGGAFAVVDDGGNLLYMERLDGTFAAAATVAAGKARTAALFQKPTRVFEDVIKQGRTSMVALQDFTPLQGGVPLVIDGQVVGAIGVSGAKSAQQDDDLAVVGANALGQGSGGCCGVTPAEPVTHLAKAAVDAAFAKGAPLLEVDGYKVHASRRERAGDAEVHELETDVIYVVSGSATFVTGGTIQGGRVTAPHEIRGPAIAGGDVRTIVPGDVIVVPAGTPHWFQAVQGPVLYYVVKVL